MGPFAREQVFVLVLAFDAKEDLTGEHHEHQPFVPKTRHRNPLLEGIAQALFDTKAGPGTLKHSTPNMGFWAGMIVYLKRDHKGKPLATAPTHIGKPLTPEPPQSTAPWQMKAALSKAKRCTSGSIRI